MRDGHSLNKPKKKSKSSQPTLLLFDLAALPYLWPSRRPRAKAQKRDLTRGLARPEAPLLKRGFARRPRLNQLPHSGEGHPLRIPRLIGDVEHGNSCARDPRLLRGCKRDWQGGDAGQE
jgi:hypothetical protein